MVSNASWMASFLHPAFRFDDPSKYCETEYGYMN